MAELLLPEGVRRKAAVSVGGEHAWRQQDVEDVLQEAPAASLWGIGGQVQFQTREGICEAYWLNFDPQPQHEGEPWSDYVSRSIDQALEKFRLTSLRSRFLAEAVRRSRRAQRDPQADFPLAPLRLRLLCLHLRYRFGLRPFSARDGQWPTPTDSAKGTDVHTQSQACTAATSSSGR